MTTEQDRTQEPGDARPNGRTRARAATAGAILLATAVGVGVGLLAAPQSGARTRTILRKQIAALGDELGDELEDLQERGGRARDRIRNRAKKLRRRGEDAWEVVEDRLADARGENHTASRAVGTAVAVAAGLAAAYLLTSDRAAPARKRVREAATTVRQRATEEWDRLQDRRSGNGMRSERATRSAPIDDSPREG